MLAAQNRQSGNDLQQQAFYGVMDLKLHDSFDPGGEFSPSDLMVELQNQITRYSHVTGTNQLSCLIT